MNMVVMGFSLLVVVLVLLIPITFNQRGIRDMFWAAVVTGLLLMGALGMLAEGGERMGWW